MAWKIIIIFLTSSVKFLFAPVASLNLGFNELQTILITTVGGCTGVFVFFYLSSTLQKRALDKRRRLILEGKKKPAKNFTKMNKLIVRIKRTMGLPGIAFCTLPFISVPVCTIIAAKFFRHRKETLPMLIGSIVFWSFCLTYLSAYIF